MIKQKLTNAERNLRYVNTPQGRFKELLKGAKASARNRHQEFNITFNDLIEIYDRQNGTCVYTGRQMSFERNNIDIISIERKDNAVGYIPDNVILICWCANRARSTLSFDEFLDMCKSVVANFDLK